MYSQRDISPFLNQVEFQVCSIKRKVQTDLQKNYKKIGMFVIELASSSGYTHFPNCLCYLPNTFTTHLRDLWRRRQWSYDKRETFLLLKRVDATVFKN